MRKRGVLFLWVESRACMKCALILSERERAEASREI